MHTHTALSIRDGCPIHKCEDMESGDSRFPEAFGWRWWEVGPLLRKQSRLHFLLGQTERGSRERVMLYFKYETKHGSWRRTREEQGQEE